MALSLVNQIPAPGAVNVSIQTPLQVRISEPVHTVVAALTKVWLIGNSTVLAYDGGAGGAQAGFSGNGTVIPGVGMDIALSPDSYLFETFYYGWRVYSENDNSDVIDQTDNFDTEKRNIVANSGFEAPGATAGKSRHWLTSGWDKGNQLGIKRGRVANPPIWTPPEGTHVKVMGSIDLTELIDDTPSAVLHSALGVGTAGTADSFGPLALPIPGNHVIVGGSVSVRKNGATEVAKDDGQGGIFDINDQSSGLVAYFKFDDDAANTVVAEATGGGVADGALVGGDNTEGLSEVGKIGKALRFDGVSDHVRVAAHSALRPQQITVCAWCSIQALISTHGYVVTLPYGPTWVNPDQFSYALVSDYNNGRTALARARINGAIHTVFGTTVRNYDEYYLLSLRYDGTWLRLYVNEVEEGTPVNVVGTIDYPAIPQDLIIGMRSGPNPDYYTHGAVDDIRVYNWALPQRIINEIAAAGPASAPYPAKAPRVKGWVDYWTPRVVVDEDGEQVWDTGDSLDIQVETRPLSFSAVNEQDISTETLTGIDFLRFNTQWSAPSGFGSGVTWKLRVFLDANEVWTKDITTGDEDDSFEQLVIIDTTSYTGRGHSLKFVQTLISGGTSVAALFDDAIYAVERFENASSSREEKFVAEDAIAATFNDGTLTYEGFESAPSNREEPFDLGTSVAATFNDGVDDVEEFENAD